MHPLEFHTEGQVELEIAVMEDISLFVSKSEEKLLGSVFP